MLRFIKWQAKFRYYENLEIINGEKKYHYMYIPI